MRTIVKGLVVALAAVATAACGTAAGLRGAPGGTPATQPRWASCEAELPQPSSDSGRDALTLPHLEGGFAPTAAVFCGAGVESRADGGKDSVATESRADDVAALVAALRLPDQPPTDVGCIAMLPTAPWFVLLDNQDRWVRPGVPTDGCGFMRKEVQQAIAGLTLTRVKTRVLREVESAAAAAAGCSQTWKDVIAIETANSGIPAGPAGHAPLLAAKHVYLCVYRAADSNGNFDHGRILPSDQLALVRQALSTAGPARKCSTSASRFALLESTDYAYGEVYVELDGCYRILVEPPPGRGGVVFAQGDADLAALLGG